MTAWIYVSRFSSWVVEKKSQYLQRLLQNGICIYIPAIDCKGTTKNAHTQVNKHYFQKVQYGRCLMVLSPYDIPKNLLKIFAYIKYFS